jgi:hypothetical protein
VRRPVHALGAGVAMPPSRPRPRPRGTALRNCCVTTTGLDDAQQSAVEGVVVASSGTYSAQLTANVTHVVAAAAGSDKHRLVCRPPHLGRVAVVKRSWVAELRGHEGDEPPDVAPHLLPPLTGFLISATGFTPDERSELDHMVRRAGATYSKTLSLNCSHLIAAAPEGKKYTYARANGGKIRTVSPQWLQQCVAKKALLDEADFPIGEPAPVASSPGPQSVANTAATGSRGPPTGDHERQRGRGASGAATPGGDAVAAAAEERTPAEEFAGVKPSFALESCCVFLVPSVLDGDSEVRRHHARLMRLAALSGAMISPRWSPAVTHAVVVSVPVAAAQVSEMRRAVVRGVALVDRDWMQHSASAGALLSSADYPPPSWATAGPADPFLDSSSGGVGRTRENASTLGGDFSGAAAGATSNIFQGVRLALGPLAMQFPDLCAALAAAVLAGRGKVLTHDGGGRVSSGVPTHVLCPMGLPAGEAALVRAMREENEHVELVTPVWVEHCVDERRLLSVSSCALFAAREFDLPLRAFVEKKIVLTISGCMAKPENADRNRRRAVLGKLATVLGARYTEKMKRSSCTLLLVDRATREVSEKIKCAVKWDIPIVSELWLLACAQSGALVAVDPYVMHFDRPMDAPRAAPDAAKAVATAGGSKTTVAPAGLPLRATNRKRRAEGGTDGPESTRPRRKPSRITSPDPASAEALMRQLAATLVKVTDANTAAGPAAGTAGVENAGNGGAESASASAHTAAGAGGRLLFNGNSADGVAGGGGSGGEGAHRTPRDTGPTAAGETAALLEKELVPPRRSDWSLEASQSQMIVHKDLTPPPAPFEEPKPVPRLRTMPSRAAKSK